jgi:hypothetical protein
MKKVILSVFLALLSTAAFADPVVATAGPNSSAAASTSNAATSANVSGLTSNGNQSITFTSPDVATTDVNYGGTYTIKNTPSVNGPNLTTSNDTCMGSTSGSVNIAGLGIGGGSSWVDTNCKRLKNARELWNMGMKGAAMALMCQDAENKEALEVTGYVCPEKKKDAKTASNAAPATELVHGTTNLNVAK